MIKDTAKNRFAVLYPLLNNSNNRDKDKERAVTNSKGTFIYDFRKAKISLYSKKTEPIEELNFKSGA